MQKAVISYFDGAAVSVVIGVGENVKAPRELAALEKQGWVIDDEITVYYKAFLAGKRQGDIPADTKFDVWVDSVQEIQIRPTRKDIELAVAMGGMTQEQADILLATYGADAEGEAGQQPA